MMSKIFRCPICHSTLINITPITLEDPLDVVGYYGFCTSFRCKVYKVVFDVQYNIVGIKKYRDIQTKRKIVAKVLSQNWSKYSRYAKKKLWQKYKRAKKYL